MNALLHAPVDLLANLSLEPEPFPIPAAAGPGAAAARYAGEPVWWIRIGTGSQPLSMMTAARRVFDGLAGLPGAPAAASALIELTPMPGSHVALLGALLGGTPVQYVLLAEGDLTTGPDPAVQLRADAGAALMTTSASAAWLGFVRQDRICRDPRAWVDDLDAAAGSDVDPVGWVLYRDRVRALVPPTIRLADHTGRPLTEGSFSVSVNSAPPQTVTLDAGGSGDTHVMVATGTARIESADPAATILASATTDAGAVAGPLTLSPGDRQVTTLPLELWLPPRSTGVTGLTRWTTGNVVEPIIDGRAYFARLVPDLRLAEGGGAVGLAGWAFVKEALADPTKPWTLLPEDDSTQIVRLIHELVSHQASVRLLVNQFLQISDDDLAALQSDAAVAIVALILLLDAASALGKLALNPAGWVALASLPAVVDLVNRSALLDLIRLLAEPSKRAVDAINGNDAGTAVWTPYPATLADNPLADNPLHIAGVPIDALTRVGVYHEKIALIQPAGEHPVPVGYVGGIDINSDRLDDPAHRAFAPFHDVQVRLEGPAVDDLLTSFAERAAMAGTTSPLTAPVTQPATPGRHVVQIGRTRFAPGPGGGRAFPSAPRGEHTTHDTVLAAIDAAKDYIYIEEQYFTPDKEYIDTLVAAGARTTTDGTTPAVKALVITLPDQTTQPYGAERRGEIIAALAATWGNRLLVGAPMRRYLNPAPQVFAGLGRMMLRADLAIGDTQAVIGPAERLPKVPFWAFVESELVYINGVAPGGPGTGPPGPPDPDDPDSPQQTWQTVTLQRGPAGQSAVWGAKQDKHDKNSCVLAVQIPGIYVHAKLMLVDDVFLSVGSSNLNRRGFWHDGESNIFAVPESLKRDPGNPALRLRCQLWAEHFGLPPEMGLSLLADPISALGYFTRSWYRGSHWMPLQAIAAGEPPAVVLSVSGSVPGLLLAAATDIVGVAQKPTIWATVIDPTTAMDPHTTPADRGPDL